jgi:hypothetical protein
VRVVSEHRVPCPFCGRAPGLEVHTEKCPRSRKSIALLELRLEQSSHFKFTPSPLGPGRPGPIVVRPRVKRPIDPRRAYKRPEPGDRARSIAFRRDRNRWKNFRRGLAR